MIIELNDVSDKELENFLLRFAENAQDQKGLKIGLAVEAINETLSYYGVRRRLAYDEENDFAYTY